MRGIVSYIIVFALSFSFVKGQSAVYLIERTDSIYVLNDALSILVNESEPLAIEQVLEADRQGTFVSILDQRGPYDSQREYWLKLQLENRLTDPNDYVKWILQLSLTLTDIEVFEVSNGTASLIQKSGFFTALPERTYSPTTKGNFVRLPLLPGESKTFYLRVRCDRIGLSPQLELKLMGPDNLMQERKKHKRANDIFVGFVLMILVYNLFLFSYARDRTYIYYSAYLFFLLIYNGYSTGDIADRLSNYLFIQQPQNASYLKLVTYLAMIAYFSFMRSFLDLGKSYPIWNKIFKFASYAAIPVALIDLFLMYNFQFNFSISDYCTIGYAFLFLAISFAFIVPLYLSGDRKGKFIIAGMIFMGLGIVLMLIDRFRSIEFSSFYLRAGSILEIIVFSLGLAYRQREVERQRQQASFELEKSKIIQQQKDAEARRLEELDRFKSQLYTNITHEFRTPLTVILGMIDRIGGFEEERDLIRRNGKNLLRLINEMLDLSRLESGKMEFKWKQGDIITYLQYLTESFYSMAEEKSIRLVFYSEVSQLMMDFDEDKTQHIVYNLLSNALKFTPKGGKVIMHATSKNIEGKTFLQVKVQDTGIGIPESALSLIFDRFYQVDPSSSISKGEGTGIGLALTKELIEMLGGNISVKSKEGLGSEFIVLIPVNRKAKPIDASSLITGSKVFPVLAADMEINPVINFNAMELPLLLIVEDNRDVAKYLQTCVEKDFRVITTYDGQEGIEKALEVIPDIVISDVMMPKRDGYDVTRTLKTDQRTSHIPIILLTAKATEEERLKGLKVGADAYLVKPFNKEELNIRLEQLTLLRKQIQKKYGGELNKSVPATETVSTNHQNLEDQFLKTLRQEVERKIDQPDLAILDLCQAVNLSHSQVYRKLKALTGKTPVQFIRSTRLQKAKELLESTDLNISEIAYEIGFSDPNYFSRTFQQTYGASPSAIRKQTDS